MKLTFTPFTLQLKHIFNLANNSRITTPVMLTRIEHDGITGYGEASMPPYLGENHRTAEKFLSKVALEQFSDPLEIQKILDYVDQIDLNNTAAKTSIDIALHDLVGKMLGKPWHQIWELDKNTTPSTSYTIGIDSNLIIKQKVDEANEYNILKVKLGRGNDKEIINTIRSKTKKPIIVDVNQGWNDKEFALDMIHWLKSQNVQLIEQPMPKEKIDDISWLTENSPLPIFADEAVQRLEDIENVKGVYSGINIKLMKCTGLNGAYQMLNRAKELDLKIMLGCMTETSCAISAASQLAPQVEWADLDGNLLISNDPFEGTKIIKGKITLNDEPGIGLSKVINL